MGCVSHTVSWVVEYVFHMQIS